MQISSEDADMDRFGDENNVQQKHVEPRFNANAVSPKNRL